MECATVASRSKRTATLCAFLFSGMGYGYRQQSNHRHSACPCRVPSRRHTSSASRPKPVRRVSSRGLSSGPRHHTPDGADRLRRRRTMDDCPHQRTCWLRIRVRSSPRCGCQRHHIRKNQHRRCLRKHERRHTPRRLRNRCVRSSRRSVRPSRNRRPVRRHRRSR